MTIGVSSQQNVFKWREIAIKSIMTRNVQWNTFPGCFSKGLGWVGLILSSFQLLMWSFVWGTCRFSFMVRFCWSFHRTLLQYTQPPSNTETIQIDHNFPIQQPKFHPHQTVFLRANFTPNMKHWSRNFKLHCSITADVRRSSFGWESAVYLSREYAIISEERPRVVNESPWREFEIHARLQNTLFQNEASSEPKPYSNIFPFSLCLSDGKMLYFTLKPYLIITKNQSK